MNRIPKILIVDDMASNIQFVAAVLQPLAYELSFAGNGEQAISIASQNDFDLILLDIMMPEMDGFEVCRRLRQHVSTQRVPIIFLTEKSAEDQILKGFEAGAVDYISKPFNCAELTARVQTHVSLKCCQNDLQNKIDESVAERVRLQEQLFQADKIALMGQMSRGLAHDFNNAIGPILGYAELIEMKTAQIEDGEKIKDYAQKIIRASEHAKSIARQLSNFGRKDESEFRPVSLAELSKAVFPLLNSVFPSDILLQCQIDQDLPLLKINPVQMQQVIMNLCINARDVMPDGGEIVLSLAHETVTGEYCAACGELIEGSYVAISVQDQGMGIDDERMQKIFQPVYKMKQEDEGTGLDLSMVNKIVHDHDGHVLVSTELNAGSCFKILWPLNN